MKEHRGDFDLELIVDDWSVEDVGDIYEVETF